MLKERASGMVVGLPQTVRVRLADLLEKTSADELMITTTTFDHADRLRSYELVAGLFSGR